MIFGYIIIALLVLIAVTPFGGDENDYETI